MNEKVFGPYLNSKGRLIIHHTWIDNNLKRRSKHEPYARWLLKDAFGIEIPIDFVVHHKDGNPLNNTLENLQVMSHGAHTTHHHKGKPKK